MITLLSPSKTLGHLACTHRITPTQPALLKESQRLIKQARTLSIHDLEQLMDISPKLATLTHERFAAFKTPFTDTNAHPAIFTFQGDVYSGFEAHTLSAKTLTYSQSHLRILSGLYGLLRPLDLMQPYRLEMGIGLANERGKNLYQFWGDRITAQLNDEAKEAGASAIVNLASEEYAKAIIVGHCALPIITPTFKESRNGTLKIIGLMAKKARGSMARWIMQHRITTPKSLCDFEEGGYRFSAALSSESQLVFTRS